MILLDLPDWYKGILMYGVIPILLIIVIILGVIAILMFLGKL